MTKIIHFHYNSDKNVNIGDEAHVLAIQETLHRHMGAVTIVNLPISFLCHYQLPPFLFSHKLPLSIHNAARILRGMSYKELLNEVNEADLVVIGGGGVYMDHLLPFNIPLINQIQTPIVIFGAGYNHNFGAGEFTSHQLESVKALGLRAKLQSVRDLNTQTFLQRLGVSSELVGDPAMFLERASIAQLSDLKTDGPRVAINIASHGWKQQLQFESLLIEAYVAMIQTLKRDYNAIVYYFIHHPGEHMVVEQLKSRGITFEEVINTPARETKAHYGSMDLTISMMLHSTILAFGEGVPSICIGYDDKNKEFMDLTGQSGRYIRVDELSPELLTEKAVQAIETLDDAKAMIKTKQTMLKSKHDAFTRSVAVLVE